MWLLCYTAFVYHTERPEAINAWKKYVGGARPEILVRKIEMQYSTTSIPPISNITHCADLEPNTTQTNSELKLKGELQICAFNPH